MPKVIRKTRSGKKSILLSYNITGVSSTTSIELFSYSPSFIGCIESKEEVTRLRLQQNIEQRVGSEPQPLSNVINVQSKCSEPLPPEWPSSDP